MTHTNIKVHRESENKAYKGCVVRESFDTCIRFPFELQEQALLQCQWFIVVNCNAKTLNASG
jgi:hypothetical protein